MAAERSSPHEVRWQQRKNGSNYETGDERGAQRLLHCFSRHFTLEGSCDHHFHHFGVFAKNVAPITGLPKSSGCDKNAVSFQLSGAMSHSRPAAASISTASSPIGITA
jgi:hypothetical protein